MYVWLLLVGGGHRKIRVIPMPPVRRPVLRWGNRLQARRLVVLVARACPTVVVACGRSKAYPGGGDDHAAHDCRDACDVPGDQENDDARDGEEARECEKG